MRKIFAVLALLLFMQASTVLADHEGKYVIGEVKDLSGIGGCLLRNDILTLFKKLPDNRALAVEFDHMRLANKCGIFSGNGRILGQILADVADQNGMLWRIVHIQYFSDTAGIEAYLITWGTENTVVKKELLQ